MVWRNEGESGIGGSEGLWGLGAREKANGNGRAARGRTTLGMTRMDCDNKKKFLILFRIILKISVRGLESFSYQ